MIVGVSCSSTVYINLLIHTDCLIERQYGVLGLAALIEAFPYSVPLWLPDIVSNLITHLQDPAPIAVSMKLILHMFQLKALVLLFFSY